MSKTRKKKELTFEVVEDHEMSQERREAVIEMLTEWMWAHLGADQKSASSPGVGDERGPERLQNGASG